MVLLQAISVISKTGACKRPSQRRSSLRNRASVARERSERRIKIVDARRSQDWPLVFFFSARENRPRLPAVSRTFVLPLLVVTRKQSWQVYFALRRGRVSRIKFHSLSRLGCEQPSPATPSPPTTTICRQHLRRRKQATASAF